MQKMQNFTLKPGCSLFLQVRVLSSAKVERELLSAKELTRLDEAELDQDGDMLESARAGRMLDIRCEASGGFYINGAREFTLRARSVTPAVPGALFWINLTMTSEGRYILPGSEYLTMRHRVYSDNFIRDYLGRHPYGKYIASGTRESLVRTFGGSLLAFAVMRKDEVAQAEGGQTFLDVMNNAVRSNLDLSSALLTHDYIMGLQAILPDDWESRAGAVKIATVQSRLAEFYPSLDSFMTDLMDSPWRVLDKFRGESHQRSVTFQLIDAMNASIGGRPDDPTRIEYAIGLAVNDVLNNGSYAYQKSQWAGYLQSLGLRWPGGDCYANIDANGGVDWCRKYMLRIREFMHPVTDPAVIYDRLLNGKSRFLTVDRDKITGDRLVYPSMIFKGEDLLAKILSEMMRRQSAFAAAPDIRPEDACAALHSHLPFPPSDGQIQAFYHALTSRLSVITGGPGAGKTTLISALVKILKELDRNPEHQIVICAPTGKAVKQLRDDITNNSHLDVTAYLGHTVAYLKVHSDLEVGMDGIFDGLGETKFDPNLCMGWTFILDEASMASLSDLVAVVQLSRFARVIIVGDKDQLGPISQGQPFRDLFRLAEALAQRGRGELLPVSWLEGNFRVAGQPEFNVLVENFNYIRNTSTIRVKNLKFVPGIFEHVDGPVTKEAADRIAEDYIRNTGKFGPAEVVICAPVHKGTGGDNYLNFLIQGRVNPRVDIKNVTPVNSERGEYYSEKGVDIPKLRRFVDMDPGAKGYNSVQQRWIRIGDRVVITENMTCGKEKTPVSNGDTGVVAGFYTGTDGAPDDAGIDVVLDTGVRVVLEKDYINSLELGYAMTVHKIQGSGYDCVMVVYDDRMAYLSSFNTKNMIYTAMTRARKYCCLYGREASFQYGLNNPDKDRATRLVERTLDYLNLR